MKYTIVADVVHDHLSRGPVIHVLCAIEGEVKVWPNPDTVLTTKVVEAGTPDDAAQAFMHDMNVARRNFKQSTATGTDMEATNQDGA